MTRNLAQARGEQAAPTLAAICVAAAIALGGCVDATADLGPSVEAHQKIERREGVSLAAATTAIVSVDGAPADLAAAFNKNLAEEARARSIALVDARHARYLVRGYLSASLTKDGAVVDYVWDVFTADKQRAQRLSDSIAAKGEGDDPWRIVGEAALTSIAAHCADDLAAYLSNTPEAAKAPAVAASPAEGPALSYAPLQ